MVLARLLFGSKIGSATEVNGNKSGSTPGRTVDGGMFNASGFGGLGELGFRV